MLEIAPWCGVRFLGLGFFFFFQLLVIFLICPGGGGVESVAEEQLLSLTKCF